MFFVVKYFYWEVYRCLGEESRRKRVGCYGEYGFGVGVGWVGFSFFFNVFIFG